MRAEELEKSLTEKTKAILLNSPNNPSGAMTEKKELKKIADMALENNLYIISDEIYEHIVYEGEFASVAGFSEDVRKRTLTINGASKTFSMTGWRIGWTAGPVEIIKAMTKFQSQTTSNPCSVSQKAYLKAVEGNLDPVKKMVSEFRKRRNFMVKRLNEMPGIECPNPDGAFYVFPDISGCFSNKIKSSMDFSMQLLEKARVCVVPGADFGKEGHVRMSYACSMENIEKALQRIEEFLRKN